VLPLSKSLARPLCRIVLIMAEVYPNVA